MKKLILTLLLMAPMIAIAQDDNIGLLDRKKERTKNKSQEEKYSNIPNKGDTKIIAKFSYSNDSLYKAVLKKLIESGYTIDKREPDLFLTTTEPKPIQHISFKMRLVVSDSTLTVSSEYISSMGIQIGYVKTEPKFETLKYTSKIYVTRDAFDKIIDFVKNTNPTSIVYSK